MAEGTTPGTPSTMQLDRQQERVSPWTAPIQYMSPVRAPSWVTTVRLLRTTDPVTSSCNWTTTAHTNGTASTGLIDGTKPAQSQWIPSTTCSFPGGAAGAVGTETRARFR